MTTRSFRRLTPLVAASALLALAFGPIPGGWKVPDGSQIIRKPPAGSGLDQAIVKNHGPDDVVLSSKGAKQTKTLLLEAGSGSTLFTLPVGAKNVVIKDANLDGQEAKGTLLWAEVAEPRIDIGGGGGSGGQ